MGEIIYQSVRWNTVDNGDMLGGMNVVSQGRFKNPVLLTYAFEPEKEVFLWQILLCTGCNLMDLAECAEEIEKVGTEQEAVDLVNKDHDPAVYDILSDLVNSSSPPRNLVILHSGRSALSKDKTVDIQSLLAGKVEKTLLWWKL